VSWRRALDPAGEGRGEPVINSPIMYRSIVRALPVSALCGLTLALLSAAPPAAAAGTDDQVLVGQVTREQIENTVPAWVANTVGSDIDPAAAAALATVEPGAEVVIVLGTWCSDSAREVPRFWRALDQVGGMVPFDVVYEAVDREKNRPKDLVDSLDLRYVPTFIVRREGHEVGRVVEEAPHGIETDLLALLTGDASGVLSGRPDLASDRAPDDATDDATDGDS